MRLGQQPRRFSLILKELLSSLQLVVAAYRTKSAEVVHQALSEHKAEAFYALPDLEQRHKQLTLTLGILETHINSEAAKTTELRAEPSAEVSQLVVFFCLPSFIGFLQQVSEALKLLIEQFTLTSTNRADNVKIQSFPLVAKVSERPFSEIRSVILAPEVPARQMSVSLGLL